MSYNDNFFEQIIAAKSALDKLPQLEREIANLKSDLEQRDNKIATLSTDLDTNRAYTEAVKAETVQLGASLDASRKSESDLSSRLSLLVDTLRDLGGNIGAALSVVEPPKVEPVVSVPSDPTPVVASTVVSSPMNSAATAGTPEVQRAADPTPTVGPVSSAPSTTSSEPQPSSAVEADRKAKGMDWYDRSGNRHEPSYSHTDTTTAEVPASPVPFAESTANPSAPAASTAPTSTAASPAVHSDAASLPEFIYRNLK